MPLAGRLQKVIVDVLGEDALNLTSESRVGCIPSWDSFAHINLLLSIEDCFKIVFTTDQISKIQTIADIELILGKLFKLVD